MEDDRQSIKVGSKYFIFLNTENPVPVKPDTASKKALEKVILNCLDKKEVRLEYLLKNIQEQLKLTAQ